MQLLRAQVLYNYLAADPWASLTVTALSLSPEMVTAEVWPAISTPLFHIWESRNACLNPTACQQHNPSSDAIKESAWFLFVCSEQRLWCLRKQASKDNIPLLTGFSLTGFLYLVFGLSHGQELGVSPVVILWVDPHQWESGPVLSRILTIVLWVGATQSIL